MTPDRARARGDQTYRRWFTEWPSTHVNAGKTVEVLALPDPVRDAAREVVEAFYRPVTFDSLGFQDAIVRLRAALEESEGR